MSQARRACTWAATSRQVAEGSGSGAGGSNGRGRCPTPVPTSPPPRREPASDHLSLEEAQAAARAEVQLVRGGPTVHPAVPGQPPQRRARLLLPQYERQIQGRPALRSSDRGVRAKRTRGYLRCSAWLTVAPLVPNSGSSWPWTAESHTGPSTRLRWVCPHPF